MSSAARNPIPVVGSPLIPPTSAMISSKVRYPSGASEGLTVPLKRIGSPFASRDSASAAVNSPRAAANTAWTRSRSSTAVSGGSVALAPSSAPGSAPRVGHMPASRKETALDSAISTAAATREATSAPETSSPAPATRDSASWDLRKSPAAVRDVWKSLSYAVATSSVRFQPHPASRFASVSVSFQATPRRSRTAAAPPSSAAASASSTRAAVRLTVPRSSRRKRSVTLLRSESESAVAPVASATAAINRSRAASRRICDARSAAAAAAASNAAGTPSGEGGGDVVPGDVPGDGDGDGDVSEEGNGDVVPEDGDVVPDDESGVDSGEEGDVVPMAAAAAASSRLSRTAVTTDSKKLVAGSKLRRLEVSAALATRLCAAPSSPATTARRRFKRSALARKPRPSTSSTVGGAGEGADGGGEGAGGAWAGGGEPAVSDARSAPRRRRRDARVRAEPPFASGRAARASAKRPSRRLSAPSARAAFAAFPEATSDRRTETSSEGEGRRGASSARATGATDASAASAATKRISARSDGM